MEHRILTLVGCVSTASCDQAAAAQEAEPGRRPANQRTHLNSAKSTSSEGVADCFSVYKCVQLSKQEGW